LSNTKIKTEESLNCPCNGIYICGLHSVPDLILGSRLSARDYFFELWNEGD